MQDHIPSMKRGRTGNPGSDFELILGLENQLRRPMVVIV
jgi:hypothetical protein